ncbi:hypothetical protein BCR33DRAFT_711092 [Rhizoclosmatium globosum]|uniref:Uncharacterized protein n=1 Tax=Rhizoclosmatium globosum TaxID=329046 RepID=A0A1Y2D3L5_9FUNG|nr:hypothetical protein BCR33DRAFT_711092 [Rhizoclosmatium globosum]|eukprot:ORY53734.1 hypothetical protein BCR33DRAFT_711092 [Rhizoclosmatium globosum]
MASTFMIATGAAPPVKEGSAEWFMVIDQEEGENLASSIVDSIVNRGQEVLFEKHIESQVLPYAVQFAKGTLLKIVQWQFFRRDAGEILPATWEPDEEPQPAVIDSWARGAIPIRRLGGTPLQAKKPLDDFQKVSASGDLVYSETDMGTMDSLIAPAAGQTTSAGKRSSSTSIVSSRVSKDPMGGSKIIGTSTKAASRRGISAHNTEAGEIPATAAERAILEENKRIVTRIQNLEKDGQKADVGYDSDGRILMVKRAGASKLFTQGVKARVVPPEESPHKPLPPPQPPTIQRESVVKRTSSIVQKSKKLGSRIPGGQAAIGSLSTAAASVRFGESQVSMSRTTIGSLGSVQSGNTSLDIPLLTETMRLAPGVTLKEGDVVKKGPVSTRKFHDRVVNPDTDTTGVFLSPTAGGSQPRALKKQQVSMTADSNILNKAKPSLRPIPFPALAVRGTTEPSGNNAYKKLPDIKAEERRVEAAQ